MKHLIYKQTVIDSVESLDWYHQNDNGEMVHGANSAEHQAWYKAEDIYTAIEEIPSAQPGWIPVTERLPKKDGDYLVTTHSGQIARYIFIGGSSEEYWRRCATAWMPLPEPYIPEGDDKHEG